LKSLSKEKNPRKINSKLSIKDLLKGPSGVSLFTVSFKTKPQLSSDKSYSSADLNEVNSINSTCSVCSESQQ